MKQPDLNALLNSFAELPEPQQDTVAEYFIRRGLEIERKGGMFATDWLLLATCDMRGGHRQAFFDAMGRASLSAWQPETVNG